MPQNIVEFLREKSINHLFATKGFSKCWSTWHKKIQSLAPANTPNQIFNLGDSLKEIFNTTNISSARSQSDVSGGGANWEALVCWYLNLCLIGRRTVVIKHSVKLLPVPIRNAITVNYKNFVSNTEADLIAITFPNLPEYTIDKEKISVLDANGLPVAMKSKRGKKSYNLLNVLNALTARDLSEIETHIIQCKTNWNDNAQIPMLWDMLYSANGFKSDIQIGREGVSIEDMHHFTYSFVTVPTVKLDKITAHSVAVKRVTNLSGGNYWGLPSKSNIAKSIKEMLYNNLKTGHSKSHLTTLSLELKKLNTNYAYFNL